MYLTYVSVGVAIFVILVLVWRIVRMPAGELEMEISNTIKRGARKFLISEYSWAAPVILVVACGLAISGKWTDVNYKTAISFVIGAMFSAVSGYVAMMVATSSNAKTTEAAKKGLTAAFRVSFTGGATTGLFITGLGLFGLSIVFRVFKGDPVAINGYAMGASLMALFARAGGGIYTKGADMAADLVGKVEENIPEDDPRNPATIADNVGDNVGDIAGLGADLLESYVESLIAMIAIAVNTGVLTRKLNEFAFYLAGCGLLAATVGVIWVRFLSKGDPERSLNSGVYLSTILMIIGTYVIVYRLGLNIGYFWCVIVGLMVGIVIGWVSQYFTSYRYAPTKRLAAIARDGPGVVVISGLGLGMLSTFIPAIIIGVGILISYKLVGPYGVALASFGMLSTLGITLAVDSYGPVADNAGGIAQMAHLPASVRDVTDRLDAVGNTTAAVGKGFAIGSAAFAALGLISAYFVAINKFAVTPVKLSLLDPRLIAGLIFGGMMPYFYGALLIKGVGRIAAKIVDESRRQFRENPDILKGKAKPQYERVIGIAAGGALRSMMLPAVLAIVFPVTIGFVFGPVALAGFLVGALITGLQVGVQMANSGAAMDNAKKYIELGNFGGKGSDAHKASVIGDTVGDPLKDTVGPSINILIKLMAVISLVIAPILVRAGHSAGW